MEPPPPPGVSLKHMLLLLVGFSVSAVNTDIPVMADTKAVSQGTTGPRRLPHAPVLAAAAMSVCVITT